MYYVSLNLNFVYLEFFFKKTIVVWIGEIDIVIQDQF